MDPSSYQLTWHATKFHALHHDWPCPYPNCNYHVPTSARLTNHIYYNHYRGRFECREPGCGTYTRYRKDIITHVVNAHPGSNKPKVTATFQPGLSIVQPIPSHLRSNPVVASNSTNLQPTPSSSTMGSGPSTSSIPDAVRAKPQVLDPPKPAAKRAREMYKTNFIKCILDECTDFFIDTDQLYDHLSEVHHKFPLLCPIEHCHRSFAKM